MSICVKSIQLMKGSSTTFGWGLVNMIPLKLRYEVYATRFTALRESA